MAIHVVYGQLIPALPWAACFSSSKIISPLRGFTQESCGPGSHLEVFFHEQALATGTRGHEVSSSYYSVSSVPPLV